MRNILLIASGQSNWSGAGKNESGAVIQRQRSFYTGTTDPLPMQNNVMGGGSCFPMLIDLCWERGIRLTVLNCAIGGASVFDYCGRAGATVPVPGATIISQGWIGPGQNITGGTTTCVEGDAGFDPLGLLARQRAEIAARKAVFGFDKVISYWCNGESDAGTGSATYADGLKSVADYMIGSGVDAHFIGLTSKQASATTGQFNALQAGITQAVSDLVAQGKPVVKGHDMYAIYGSNPPLYAESDGATYVHMTGRGQYRQSIAVNDVLKASGF